MCYSIGLWRLSTTTQPIHLHERLMVVGACPVAQAVHRRSFAHGVGNAGGGEADALVDHLDAGFAGGDVTCSAPLLRPSRPGLPTSILRRRHEASPGGFLIRIGSQPLWPYRLVRDDPHEQEALDLAAGGGRSGRFAVRTVHGITLAPGRR